MKLLLSNDIEIGRLALEERAESGLLPEVLHITDIALLLMSCSSDFIRNSDDWHRFHQIYKEALERALRSGELISLTGAEARDFLGEEVAICSEKKGVVIRNSQKEIAVHNSAVPLPQQTSLIHRDAFSDWLKQKGEWPLPESCLLFRWWPQEKTIPTNKNFNVTDEEKLRFEKECDSDKPKDENITKISFYKNGQIWKIGTPGKEEDFTHLNGYEMIHFLLGRETENLDASVVYNLGKCSTNFSDDVQVSKSVTDYMQGETKQSMIDEKTRETCKEKIEILREKIITTTAPEKAPEYKEEIEKLEKYLADASNKTKISDFRSRNKENCRINVQKRIKEALEVIYESAPYLKEFLNSETIHTGGKCWYKSDPSHPVQWILSPPV